MSDTETVQAAQAQIIAAEARLNLARAEYTKAAAEFREAYNLRDAAHLKYGKLTGAWPGQKVSAP